MTTQVEVTTIAVRDGTTARHASCPARPRGTLHFFRWSDDGGGHHVGAYCTECERLTLAVPAQETER